MTLYPCRFVGLTWDNKATPGSAPTLFIQGPRRPSKEID